MNDLHRKIMNLETGRDPKFGGIYKIGYRDARHDAAELALAADQEIAALRAQLETARADALREAGEACKAEMRHCQSMKMEGGEDESHWLWCEQTAIDCRNRILALIDKEPSNGS